MLVKGIGNKNAKIMLVSTAPGPHEERAGRPFAGPGGAELMKLLSRAGVNIKDCFFDNVMQTSVKKEPTEDELRLWYSDLRARIEEVNPNVVVPLGKHALLAIAGRYGIDKWRGSIIESTLCPGRKVIPTFDPAFLLYEGGGYIMREPMTWDLQRVNEESRSSEIRVSEWHLDIRPSIETVEKAFDRLEKSDRIVVDIEGLGNILCCGLGDCSDWAISIPFSCSDGSKYWNSEQEAWIFKRIAEIAESSKEKIGHNLAYDWANLRLYGVELRSCRWDTMEMHTCVWPELPHALAFLCSVYTKQPYYKDEGKTWSKGVAEDAFWRYNATDVVVTGQSFLKLHDEMSELGVHTFYNRHMTNMFQIKVRMELDGININSKLQDMYKIETKEEIERLEKEFESKVGRSINVRSPKQMKDFIERDLGLSIPYNRKTRKPSLNEDALQKLLIKHRPALLDLILTLRGKKVLLSSYIDLKKSSDGKVHCHYGYTESLRFKSSKSLVLGGGLNLQTPPRSTRYMYIPDDPAFLFGSFDLSQAEDRWVAYAAPVSKKVELYKKGMKVHTYFASIISEAFTGKHLEYHEVPKDDSPGALYFTAKRTNLGQNYGLGLEKFALIVHQPVNIARVLTEIFHRTFPEIRQVWWEDVKKQLAKDRTLTNPDGSKRIFLERWGDELFRAAYAHGPQEGICYHTNQIIQALFYSNVCALESKLTYEGYLECIGLDEQYLLDQYHAVRESQLKIKLQVHDQCVYQAIPESIPALARIADAAANRPIIGLKGGPFVIPAEHSIGASWGDAPQDSQEGAAIREKILKICGHEAWLHPFRPNDEKAEELASKLSRLYRESRIS
jgi:uracil-DNA glycosylase family 4